MPSPFHDDTREGWYLEASYLLDQFAANYLSGDVGYHIGRMELVSMWSAVNQNQIAAAADAFTAFSRKPREVAVGLDYWIQPKMVAKFEYRRIMQDGHRDFNGLLTSFVYGF